MPYDLKQLEKSDLLRMVTGIALVGAAAALALGSRNYHQRTLEERMVEEAERPYIPKGLPVPAQSRPGLVH